MRRAFIAFGIVVFLVYCWASVVYQNRVPLPDYKLVKVDLLGGKSRAAWDADTQGQFQRLMELENRHYQLPINAVIKAGVPGKDGVGPGAHVGPGGNIPVNEPLNSDDFAYLIAKAPAGQGVTMELRDTSAIYDLVARNYLLRDNIASPSDPDGAPLFDGGTPIDKKLLDRMRAAGITSITVTGIAAPVNFQVGTALMVAIIFLTLVAALKPMIWDPFLVLLEKRRRELEIGDEAERQNQQEAGRYEEERRRRNAELNREIQELRMKGQNETTRQVGEILKAARAKEKAAKLEGLRQLGDSVAAAEGGLEGMLPDLAESVADALTPGRGGEAGKRTES